MVFLVSLHRVALVAFVLCILAGCSGVVSAQSSSSFHERACASYPASTSPWHIANLYDCETRVLYVPYHLWTGAEWDGSHTSADSCMHEAQTEFRVNGTSLTRINGPVQWPNPVTNADEKVWARTESRRVEDQLLYLPRQGNRPGS